MKNIKKELLWIYKYIKKFRFSLLIIIILGSISSMLSVFSAAISKYLVNAVTGDIPLSSLKWIIPLMAGSFIGVLIVNIINSKISFNASLNLTYKMKSDVFENTLRADWQSVSEFHTGDLLNRMTSDVSSVVTAVVDVIPSIFSLAVRLISALCVIFYFDSTMGILVLLVCPAAVIATRLLGKKIREYNLRSQEALSENQSFIQESFQNLMTVKSFGITDRFIGRLRELQDKHKEVSTEKNNFSIFLSSAFSVLYQIASYSTLGWGAYRVYSGAIKIGDFFSFTMLIGQVQAPLSAIISMIPSAITATSSAGRILDILNIPSEKINENNINIQTLKSVSIDIKNVSFSYDKKKDILKNVNIKAESGTVTALIGPSGEGKTTIIRLILGIILPDMGTVSINGNIPVSSKTREYFSYVPQGNTMFSGTIAENIRLGNFSATDDEVIDALKSACAWDFVKELPKGMQTEIGERGFGLSEGQAQRIAIARALVRKAPVLLLDEATSALDIETEKDILQNIAKNLNGKTCIVITHRATVFELCNAIYRISNHNAGLEAAPPEEI